MKKRTQRWLVAALLCLAGNASANTSEVGSPRTADCSWKRIALAPIGASTSPAKFSASISAGDIDRDGFDDLAVNAWGENANTGSITVFYGGPIPFVRRQKLVGGPIPFVRRQKLVGGQPGAMFGSSFTLVDANKDRFLDLVSRNGANLEVYFGGPAGVSTQPGLAFSSRSAVVETVHDLNGDGFRELALGDSGFNSNTGRFLVFFSREDWSGLLSAGSVQFDSADIIITGTVAGGRFGGGNGIASIGSYGIAVGAYSANKVYLFRNETLQQVPRLSSEADVVLARDGGSRFGYALSFADVNGDGLADLLIGEPYAHSIHVLIRNSDRTFPGASSLLLKKTRYFGTRIGSYDLNLDGSDDVLVGQNNSGDSQLSFFLLVGRSDADLAFA